MNIVYLHTDKVTMVILISRLNPAPRMHVNRDFTDGPWISLAPNLLPGQNICK